MLLLAESIVVCFFWQKSKQNLRWADDFISDWFTEYEREPVQKGALAWTRSDLPDAKIGSFPDTVLKLAAKVNAPKCVTLAQFALESTFGLHDLNASNYFGHTFPVAKKYDPTPKFVWASTNEFQNGKWIPKKRRFAKYENIQECFQVHDRLMNAYGISDQLSPAEALWILRQRKYATDTGYTRKLARLIERYSLDDYD